MQAFGISIGSHHLAQIVQAFQGAHAGGSHGDGPSLVCDELLNCLLPNGNVFRVHLVPSDFCALNGFEGASPYVQGHLLAVNALGIQRVQHALCEVQAGGRCSHAALYLAIYGLVRLLVALLSLAVQVGRDGQLAHRLEQFGKGCATRPLEPYAVAGSVGALSRGGELNGAPFHLDGAAEGAFLPFLQVSHQAVPGALLALHKVLLVFLWHGRFEQEDLNQRARLLREVQACLYDAGVVEDHQRALGQVLRQLAEVVFADYSFIIYEQFAAVAFGQGVLGNALVGQRIVEIAYLNVLCIH